MCVRLEVLNGRIVAPEANAAFWFSPLFSSALSRQISADRARTILQGELNGILTGLPMPYAAALAPGESDRSLNDPLTTAVRTCSGSLDDYASRCMQPWSDANTGRGQPADVLVDGAPFYNPLIASSTSTALSFSEELSSLDEGLAIFFIADLFESASVTIQLPFTTSAEQKKRIQDLRSALKPLDGTLWDAATIREELSQFYSPLGLAAQSVPGPAGTNEIAINEGFRIARIVLTVGDVSDRDVGKILWIVLSQTDFDRARKRPLKLDKDDAVLNYSDLGYAMGDEPFEFAGRIQEQQLMLAEIGFTASLQPSTMASTTAQQYHDIRIQKSASDPPQQSTTPAPAPAPLDPGGAAGIASPSQTPPAAPSSTLQSLDKLDKPWFVGGGLIYKPGQSLSVFGLLTRSRIPFPLPNSSFSIQGGYPAGSTVAVNYSADYIGFDTLHQRLSLNLNGSRDVTLHRYLLGQKLDQLQTGGTGRLIWEPFHDLHNGLLQVVGEFQRSTVTLESNVAVAQKINLSTFRVTALYQYQSELSRYSHFLKIEPFVETGLGLSATESVYGLEGADVNYHQNLGPVAPDFTAHFQQASRGTPLVEMPSFGGAEVLRGFRADDAIGRRYATLQSELWVPVPGIPRAAAGGAAQGELASILSKLRLSPLGDFGGAWQTSGSEPGMRAGAGLGLRLDMTAGLYHIVGKLDWAYGFGPAATGGSRGKFYFSLVSDLPF